MRYARERASRPAFMNAWRSLLNIRIEDFGSRVASVWENLRPATRNLFEQAFASIAPAAVSPRPAANIPYDRRAEWELSRLLTALDERAADQALALSAEQRGELLRLTETCAAVLQQSAQSAEVFAQLLERALHWSDYRKVDQLSDAFPTQLSATEICELARHPNPAIRAIAQDALAQSPTSVLVELLGDPVDAEIVRDALLRQADEYGVEEARWIIAALEEGEPLDDEM